MFMFDAGVFKEYRGNILKTYADICADEVNLSQLMMEDNEQKSLILVLISFKD